MMVSLRFYLSIISHLRASKTRIDNSSLFPPLLNSTPLPYRLFEIWPDLHFSSNQSFTRGLQWCPQVADSVKLLEIKLIFGLSENLLSELTQTTLRSIIIRSKRKASMDLRIWQLAKLKTSKLKS